MIDDLAVGLLALLLGSSDLLGAHEQNGLDGGAAHDVDEVVNGGLGVLDLIEHGEQKLAVLGQEVGKSLGIERAAAVGTRDNVVRFGHRWWFLCEGNETPDDTASSSAGAATDLSTFHYGGDIIADPGRPWTG
jgi:hypothetical protein